MEHGTAGEVYNICSGRGTSIAQIVEMFAAIAKQSPRVVTDPALVRPVENEQVVGSHDKLTTAVGWRPTHTLEASLRGVYDYWLDRVT